MIFMTFTVFIAIAIAVVAVDDFIRFSLCAILPEKQLIRFVFQKRSKLCENSLLIL